MYIFAVNVKVVPINGKSFIFCIKYNIIFPKIRKSLSSMFKEIDCTNS